MEHRYLGLQFQQRGPIFFARAPSRGLRERERLNPSVNRSVRNRSLSLAEISIFEEHFLQPDFDCSDRLDKSLAVHVQCKI